MRKFFLILLLLVPHLFAGQGVLHLQATRTATREICTPQSTLNYKVLKEVCGRLQIPSQWLYCIIYAESGCEIDAENPYSHAKGYIQFLPSTLRLYGVSDATFKGYTSAEQLLLVESYLANEKRSHGAYKSQLDLYLAIFQPISRRNYAGDATEILREGTDGYTSNAVLDKNRDGVIKGGELMQHFRAMLRRRG
jgi:hypothetical protein